MNTCRCCLTGASPVTTSTFRCLRCFLDSVVANPRVRQAVFSCLPVHVTEINSSYPGKHMSLPLHRTEKLQDSRAGLPPAVDEVFLSIKRFNRRIGCNVTLLTLLTLPATRRARDDRRAGIPQKKPPLRAGACREWTVRSLWLPDEIRRCPCASPLCILSAPKNGRLP